MFVRPMLRRPPSSPPRALTVDGFELGSFGELVAINSEIEVPENLGVSGNQDQILKKLPGKRVPPTVTLKRGMTTSLEIQAWHDAIVNGQMAARKNCSLVMYAVDGRAVVRYYLENAWPSKIVVDGLKNGASEVMMETITPRLRSLITRRRLGDLRPVQRLVHSHVHDCVPGARGVVGGAFAACHGGQEVE
jgi:phage tail-like protein